MRSLSKLLLAVFVLFTSVAVSASTNLQSDSYTTWYGDVNGDGYEDIYLEAKKRFILISGTITVPFYIFDSSNFYISGIDSSLHEITGAVNTSGFESLSIDFSSGDFNGDGRSDLIAQVRDSRFDSFLLYGQSDDSPNIKMQPTILDQDLRFATITVRDVNSDGRDDVIVHVDSITEVVATANGSGTFHEISQFQTGSTVSGAIAGSFDVSSSGSASYSIPIAVPPGGAGMSPSLAFSYSSGSGNGIMGMGWSVSGLEMVSECSEIYEIDGKVSPDGRYCLNGQRLTHYGSGTYYTEGESFSRIKKIGSGATAYFKVEYKSGEIAYFGKTSGERLTSGGRNLWLLTSVEDRYGNKRTYNYALDQSNKSYYLERINYPGGYVKFNYKTRNDEILGYDLGQRSEITKLLWSVESGTNAGILARYGIEYSQSPSTGYSRVDSITQCGSDGSCLAPTSFKWSLYSRYNRADSIVDFRIWEWDSLRFVDMDGDGVPDPLYVATTGNWETFLSSRNELIDTRASGANWKYALDLDIDGDGDAEILVPYNGWKLLDYTGVGNFSFTTILDSANGYKKYPQILDIDGDGLQDLLLAYSEKYHVRFNEGGRFGSAQPTNVYHPGEKYPFHRPIDIDGDGKQELLFHSDSTTYVLEYDGAQFSRRVVLNRTSGYEKNFQLADFNGDGLSDMAFEHQDKWWVAFNKGGVFNYNIVPTGFSVSGYGSAKTINYDDDGRDDIIFKRDNYLHKLSYTVDKTFRLDKLNKVKGGTVPKSGSGLDFTSYQIDSEKWYTADFNQDGVTDFVYFGCVNPFMSSECTDKTLQQLSATPTSYNFQGITNYSDGYLQEIDNGFGQVKKINYTRHSDDNSMISEFPYIGVNSGVTVVSSVDTEIDGQKTHTLSYSFSKGLFHRRGLGFLGYKLVTRISDNLEVKTKTESTYGPIDSSTNSLWRLNKQIVSIAKSGESNYTRVSESTYQYERKWRDGNGHLPANSSGWYSYLSFQTDRNWELDGSLEKIVTNEYRPDLHSNYYGASTYTPGTASGNMRWTETVVTDESGAESYYVRTNSTYSDNYNNWILGRVARTEARSGGTNREEILKTSAWSYYSSTGYLKTETVEPDNADLMQTTSYEYHPTHGQKTRVTVSDAAGHQRTSFFTWDTLGRYVNAVQNSKGHTVFSYYHAISGLKVRSVDLLGNESFVEYDGFGRTIHTTSPTGVISTTEYAKAGSGDPAGTRHSVTVTDNLGGWGKKFFNTRGDVIEAHALNALGEKVAGKTIYSAIGTVLQQSEPYKVGASPAYWTLNKVFDKLQRPTQIINPEGKSSKVVFSANQITYTNEKGLSRTDKNFADGKLEEVIDHQGNRLAYVYDGAGNMTSVTDVAGGITTTIAYDNRGRKTSMSDPDKGQWEYQYNAFGELIAQKDAEGQIVCQAYDELGRMTKRIDGYLGDWDTGPLDNCSGDTGENRTTQWIYDTAVNGQGKLHKVIGTNGYSETYSYDSFGRAYSVSKVIDGEAYVSRTEFDEYGRVVRSVYPSGLAVPNHYNSFGVVDQILKDDNQTKLWKLVDVDVRGNVTEERLANGIITRNLGYTPEMGRAESITSSSFSNVADLQMEMVVWDEVGNLQSRTDAIRNKHEKAYYDDLNRLQSLDFWANGNFSGDPTSSETMAYAANGNITSKWDVSGNYEYGETTCGVQAGPHAVTSAGDNTYCYDRNGNMVAGAGRTIQWSPFGKPTLITRGSTTVEFVYGPSRSRIKRVDTNANGTTVTKYLGGYEKVTKPSGVVEERHYIGGFAVLTKVSNETQLKENYMLKDHLGSVVAYVDINELGANPASAVENSSFDAWGKRRQADWSEMAFNDLLNYKSDISDRGYTGHEQIDEVGLIHMNGRVYDPVLGRFLSADPVVQAPKDLQSYNRYTYVRNNPLTLTDPSGFSWWSKTWHDIKDSAKDIGKFFVNPQLYMADKASKEFGRFARKNKYVAEVAQIGVCAFAAPFCIDAVMFITYGVTDGDLRATAKAGAIAFVQMHVSGLIGDYAATASGYNGAVGSFIGHGILGAAASVAQGGSVKSGFLAGSIGHEAGSLMPNPGGSTLNIAASTAVAAIIGGTVSKLSGGNFANGARSAAMQHLFNSVAHNAQKAWDKVKGFGQSVADEVAFGAKAVYNGISEDYEHGGVLGVVIGATGGPTDQGFFEQVNSDYASTSIVFGPINNLDKTLTSLAVGGAMAERYGGYSFGKLILKGPAPHLGTYGAAARLAAGTTAINSVLITGSYEGGNYFGAALRAGINRTARLFE